MYRQRRKCSIESCHWLSMPPPPTNGQESQRLWSKIVTQTISLCLRKKEYNQTSWKEFIARIIDRVLKSEIKFLYPKWPLPATVIA